VTPQVLDIYFIDVEGGQATLIVTPDGESMLVDSGYPGFEGRDTQRIMEALDLAGLEKLDYMLITHYHGDHVGAVPELVKRVSIETFIDHGPNQEDQPNPKKIYEDYVEIRNKVNHIEAKPGDRLPLKGTEIVVLTAAGNALASPLEGAGDGNPLCVSTDLKDDDPTENARSLGFLLKFGDFSFINLGDLTWNKELELACPRNLVGEVDVYLSTHHGLPSSGPAALVHALRPRVAIMNNGSEKGGSPEAWKVMTTVPGFEDLWQLHYSLAGGDEYNSSESYLANLEVAPEDVLPSDHKGHWIHLSAKKDGSFTITNSRNNFSKTYGVQTEKSQTETAL